MDFTTLPTMQRAGQYGLKYPPCKWASLPAAADYVGVSFYCADAPTGASLVVSDGIRWRPFARGIYANRVTITAAMGGVAQFVYDVPFTGMLPTLGVTLTDITGLGRLTDSVQEESLAGCKVKVTRGTALPTLSTGLLGFDPFTGGNVAGVVVNLVAFPRA